MENFSTEYRDQMIKNDEKNNQTAKSLHTYYDNVTVAGVPRYLKRPNSGMKLIEPQDFKT